MQMAGMNFQTGSSAHME
ncbi:MAG: hypothetical protein E7B11_07025 [Clostridiales bacterium]|nr:hypothetical protein [Clostridiales bacterium]